MYIFISAENGVRGGDMVSFQEKLEKDIGKYCITGQSVPIPRENGSECGIGMDCPVL